MVKLCGFCLSIAYIVRRRHPYIVYRFSDIQHGSCSFAAGPLASPDNVTISSQNYAATQLQWKPPYYTLNQESAVIHVDSHITHYTVYTMDISNDSMSESVNVTETSFTPTNNIPLCPMYQISAWNAGGEGELSEPVQDGTPQGKQSGTD